LAFYRGEIINDRLTGRSSEKIALYFQCGIPIVAFRHETYEHIEAAYAGVLIDRIEELPAAVARILQDYKFYTANAFSCYQKYYCFENNFISVLSSLQDLIRV
jgi:glycosyltransferase involved in cell wall biosynthesis